MVHPDNHVCWVRYSSQLNMSRYQLNTNWCSYSERGCCCRPMTSNLPFDSHHVASYPFAALRRGRNLRDMPTSLRVHVVAKGHYGGVGAQDPFRSGRNEQQVTVFDSRDVPDQVVTATLRAMLRCQLNPGETGRDDARYVAAVTLAAAARQRPTRRSAGQRCRRRNRKRSTSRSSTTGPKD